MLTVRSLIRTRAALFVAFAFAVMADPVSSVAYAIEAALRALGGNLGLLLPTMAVVVGIIGVVVINYQQIVDRFPHGGGAASAVATSFGLEWAFLPLGALLVDFLLTIAISVAAASSAMIAYVPGLAPDRVPLTLLLLAGVASLSLLGHVGRLVFASMTVAFLAVAAVLLVTGSTASAIATVATATAEAKTGGGVLSMVLAFPVAMALATGVEAPSSAIAQLGQLDDDGRRSFGRWTLWLTLGVVGVLTLALTSAAVRLGVGIPPADSTMLAELARRATSPLVFGLFQASSAILLLAAASSSLQAGPGLLKALARGPDRPGVMAAAFGRTNRHHTPVLGVLTCFGLAAAMVVVAGSRDQVLVLFYAVAVFISFLAGLVAMARLHWTEHRPRHVAFDLLGAGLVAFTLVMNLARGYPILSLAASLAVGFLLRFLWIRSGRPTGVRVEFEADPELEPEPEPLPAGPEAA